jgi:hypothetical protein
VIIVEVFSKQSKNQQTMPRREKRSNKGGKRPGVGLKPGSMTGSKALPVVALEINFFKFNQVFKLWRCAQFVPNGMRPTITERHRT